MPDTKQEAVSTILPITFTVEGVWPEDVLPEPPTLRFHRLRGHSTVHITHGVVRERNGRFLNAGLHGSSPRPAQLVLEPNFPNPFNPETTIRYQIPEATPVQLEIFNLLGQPIRTLVHDTQSAGSYSVAWDGSGDDSKPVASGVYLYRLQTSEGVAVRKLILIH